MHIPEPKVIKSQIELKGWVVAEILPDTTQMYYCEWGHDDWSFEYELYRATFFTEQHEAEEAIKELDLHNCIVETKYVEVVFYE